MRAIRRRQRAWPLRRRRHASLPRRRRARRHQHIRAALEDQPRSNRHMKLIQEEVAVKRGERFNNIKDNALNAAG